MPKRVKELSATEVKRLTYAVSKTTGKPYNAFHAVGGVAGLLLQVTPTEAKSWLFRTTVDGERIAIGLGSYPSVTLSRAREKAREMLVKIDQGINPVEEKKTRRREAKLARLNTITFAVAMANYIKMKAKEFKNPRQAQQWENSLTTYAIPHLGDVPVREIELPHIKAVLDPIWEEKTETANRVRARIENILGWAAVHGYRSNENPARWQGYLDGIYPSPEKIKKKKSHEALAIDDLPGFIQELKKRCTGMAALALEFTILTASRTNEVIGDKRIGKPGITWREIDFDRKLWIIPADRMKSGREHRVPLSPRALEILREAGPGLPDAYAFPGPKDAIASNNFLSAVLKRLEIPVTVHGFRSTFKDWARERASHFPDELSELALAHVNSDATRAAYARSDLIENRRQLMTEWQEFCLGAK